MEKLSEKYLKKSLQEGYVYILTSDKWRSENIFRVGCAYSLNAVAITFNMFSPDETYFMYVSPYLVSRFFDKKKCHELLKDYRIDDTKEFFKLKEKLLLKIIRNYFEGK